MSEKLASDGDVQVGAVDTSNRGAPMPSSASETPTPTTGTIAAVSARGTGASSAYRAASMSSAQRTVGTARLNRLMNPPLAADRPAPNGQPDDTLPIGAAEASRAPRGGQPLETNVRRSIEGTLGSDLGDVRVHTGPDANAAAESLSARAFTTGTNIFLGPGESPTDTHLIAHEAAHVVQDPGSSAVRLYTPSGGDERESQARRVADAAVGVPAGPAQAAGPGAKRPAITDSDREAMKADVEQIVGELRGFLTNEWKIASFAMKWAERDRAYQEQTGYTGADYIDAFVLETQKRAYTRRTLSGAAWTAEQHGIVYDDVWNELGGERLRIWKDRVSKSRYGTTGPREAPPENFWKTLSRQEAIGLWGMLKGMGTAAASGLVDAPAKAIVHALQKAGVPAADPLSAAAWLEKQYDISGEAMFGKEYSKGEPLLLGMNAAQIGSAGGAVIWQLVMLGTGKVSGVSWAPKALQALGILGSLEGVRESADTIGKIVLAKQAAGKEITAGELANDPDFRRAATGLVANIVASVAAVAGGGGAKPDAAAKATIAAWKAAGLVVSGAQLGERLGTCVQEGLSADPPGEKERKVAALLGEAISAAVNVVGGVHESREAAAKGATPPETEGGATAAKPTHEPAASESQPGSTSEPKAGMSPPPSAQGQAPVPPAATEPVTTPGQTGASAIKPPPSELPVSPVVPVQEPAPVKPAPEQPSAPAPVKPAPDQPSAPHVDEAAPAAPDAQEAGPAESPPKSSDDSATGAKPSPGSAEKGAAAETRDAETSETEPKSAPIRPPESVVKLHAELVDRIDVIGDSPGAVELMNRLERVNLTAPDAAKQLAQIERDISIKEEAPAPGRVEDTGSPETVPDEPGRMRELDSLNRPQWMKKRENFQLGNDFNEDMRGAYDAREIELANGRRLDGYTQGEAIVSRKRTQLAEVKTEYCEAYVNELLEKYGPGNRVADTPSNRSRYPHLVNTPLTGQMILEVPVQAEPIPPEIGNLARRAGILIRDDEGHVYNDVEHPN